MRLLLQQRPDGREAPRFVQLQLEADLLGGWTLVREAGQIGGRSTLKREQYLDQASAHGRVRTRARPAAEERLPADVRAGRGSAAITHSVVLREGGDPVT